MNFPGYLWKSNTTRWQILLVVFFVFIGIPVFRAYSQSIGLAEIWQNWLEAFLAFLTAFVAIFIWLNEKKQDWENSLPKKLDAFFIHNEEIFYQVENAPLTGENDIRQWGQQIGFQMNGGNLKFNGFKVEGPNRGKDTEENYVMRYKLTVWLQSINEGRQEKTWIYGNDGKLIKPNSIENGHLHANLSETETNTDLKITDSTKSQIQSS